MIFRKYKEIISYFIKHINMFYKCDGSKNVWIKKNKSWNRNDGTTFLVIRCMYTEHVLKKNTKNSYYCICIHLPVLTIHFLHRTSSFAGKRKNLSWGWLLLLFPQSLYTHLLPDIFSFYKTLHNNMQFLETKENCKRSLVKKSRKSNRKGTARCF